VYSKRYRRQVSAAYNSCQNLSGRRGLSASTIGTETAPAQDFAKVSSATNAEDSAANPEVSIAPIRRQFPSQFPSEFPQLGEKIRPLWWEGCCYFYASRVCCFLQLFEGPEKFERCHNDY
jgi:hypothetical protein